MTDRSSHAANGSPRTGVDTSVPHSARIWNYWLGGKDNYAVDREAGDQFQQLFPGIVDIAREDRAFLGRAVRYLAGEVGIRQFLDIGTGLPTADNTHEVAQRVAPDARIVCVDNDPLVLTHARALLTSAPQGATAYVDADLYQPETIVRAAAQTLDFTRPVALIFMGVLGHITDYETACTVVNRLVEPLPSGSHVAIADGTDTDPAYVAAIDRYNESGAIPHLLRTPDQIAGFFGELDVVEPGVVPCPRWRPDEATPKTPAGETCTLCGVARKP